MQYHWYDLTSRYQNSRQRQKGSILYHRQQRTPPREPLSKDGQNCVDSKGEHALVKGLAATENTAIKPRSLSLCTHTGVQAARSILQGTSPAVLHRALQRGSSALHGTARVACHTNTTVEQKPTLSTQGHEKGPAQPQPPDHAIKLTTHLDAATDCRPKRATSCLPRQQLRLPCHGC